MAPGSSRTSSDSAAAESFPPLPDFDATHHYSAPDVSSTASAPVAVAPEDSRNRVAYDLNVDVPPSPKSAPHFSPASPLRRRTRTNVFRTLEEFEDFENRPGWRPGAEPGIDPKNPDGGQDAAPDLHAECQVTVVDFSQGNLEIHELDNSQLIQFIRRPQPSWVKCRWINVNGLSWDVIQALGEYKDLHRLAIEDIMNTRNRTKADWYPGHAFMILTCLKLVRVIDDDSDSSDGGDEDEEHDKNILRHPKKAFQRWISERKEQHPTTTSALEKGTRPLTPGYSFTQQPTTSLSDVFNPNTLRTLQRYGAPNSARTEYMEKHSALAARGLAVSAEQVSMFITSDNTVIAFFEQSADNIEEPILARLRSPTTILRKSCDASMVAQAIIDAIIDLAIPVTTCYADIVGDLELDILTHPNIKHTKSLYIIISEINKMFSFVNPIQALISSLRDHKTKLSQEAVSRELQNPMGGVIITPVTYTYLGDVFDHCVLITENLTQIKESANHMIDLIFNTIATYQNESMKQLTIVTIIFLPLTFITGYFGQNFGTFPEAADHDTTYFWKIATPVVVGTIIILMREILYESLVTFFQRRHILGLRKRKKRRIDNARKKDKDKLRLSRESQRNS
ncbi:putative family metal ion protein [Rosellinia necatrix]|uniref:Putative family metal ion protein n=1 Tax=Rosellinia necatrix TaxID=77044 RepID=A0A1W2TKP1_ROSNE|nr:putative family metal ion protein [Rosellinia necatrix]